MNTLTFAAATVLVIVSVVIASTYINDMLRSGSRQAELDEGQRSFERLDREIRNFNEAEGAKRLLQFTAGSGVLRIYGSLEIVEYQIGHGFGLVQNFTRNNIAFIYDDSGVRLVSNYTGLLDISGEESSSGRFFIVLKKNPTDIGVDII